MSAQEDPPERKPDPGADEEERSLWDVYWDRFRRQQVDDPVEERREGIWDRFKRQQVDDPVTRRRPREDPDATGGPD
jgi:hypothetical protein